MSKTITQRSGAQISELIDPATREKLEDLQQRLGQQEALKRPRDADGRFSAVPRDQLVKNNKTLRRLSDIAAAASSTSRQRRIRSSRFSIFGLRCCFW